MDVNDDTELTKYLPVEKLQQRYEYLSTECERLKEILEELGLLELANVLVQTKIAEEEEDAKGNEIDWKAYGTISELEASIQMYEKKNEEVCENIKVAEREVRLNEAVLKDHTVTNEDLVLLAEKTRRYERELKQLNEKYSWLSDRRVSYEEMPRQIELLKELRNERNHLQEEIDSFCGLKPNIAEANQQLAAVKAEHEALMSELSKISKN